MCTRFYISIEDQELQDIAKTVADSLLAKKFEESGAQVRTSGEIFPTNVVPVLATAKSGRQAVFPMQWGFQMAGSSARKGSPLVNARVETADSKPTFRDAWQKHRCIIPASHYFEWEHRQDPATAKTQKIKYALRQQDASITWLCGLYRMENGLPHFVVLTRPSADGIAFIHDRMPLILPQDLTREWIDPKADPAELIASAVQDMHFCEAAVL